MVFSLTQTSARQREILEIILGNGWDFMKGILTKGKADSPTLPPPAVLRKILVELGPFYVKFGQLLSTRPDLLPPQYITALTALQAKVPTIPWSAVETVLKQELKSPLEEVFSKIDPSPIAAGSIAQIHRATLKNGQEVAVKIQRPGIDFIVEQDVKLIKAIAELIALTDIGKDYDIVALANDFTSAVEAELDFRKEGEYTNQLRRNLKESKWFDTKQLVIPKIYWEITTKRILGLEWLEGKPILEANFLEINSHQEIDPKRKDTTTLLFRAFFQQIYVNGFFHADPHPGNIFYLQNGKIALIDCGMIGRLDPHTQRLLTEMLLAIVDFDAVRCSELTLELSESSMNKTNLENLKNDYQRLLRKYYNLSLSQLNFSAVFYEILQVARSNKIQLPGNLGLYAKCLANLEGVARSLNPEVNLIDEFKPLMTDIFQRQLLGDTPTQSLLRIALDLKALSLRSPRQIEVLLDRLSSETLQWNIKLRELDTLRRSIDDSANRLSFSIVVGSLIMGAAIISTGTKASQLTFISNILFASASFLGLWLIISILRSGRLK
jgi:ubiquinone biosynthesis protein